MSSFYSSKKIKTICVFCGSSPGNGRLYLEAAEHLREVLAYKKINLIYGGGSLGLIGDVATAAYCRGSHVTGIIPQLLAEGNLCGKTISKEDRVLDISKRLENMIYNSDAFIALPGGLGTLEELFTIANRNLLGIYSKLIGLLNVNDFYDDLLKFLDYAMEQNFVAESGRQIFIFASTAEDLFEKNESYLPRV